MIILIDLFGTLIPQESDIQTHETLSKLISIVHGFKDSWKDLYELYREALDYCGDSNKAVLESYRKFIALNNVVPLYTYEELVWLHSWIHIETAKPYPDVEPFLNIVSKQYEIALVSDTFHDIARGILRYWNLDQFFNAIIATHSYGLAKPDPKIVELALKLLEKKSRRIVIIGDSYKDYELAKNSSSYFIAIARSPKSMESFSSLNVPIAKNLIEAYEYIKKLELDL
ncbi:MAG TPA: HAD family hydrolase [Ignisphaera sp.]|nr:HAD family hydrolase [Ignisphaera sp.]